MTIIEQIKAEIERLYGEYKDKFHQCGDQYHLGLIDGLDMAERVLDSLEEPVCEELNEAAEQYVQKGYLPEAWVVRPAFIAGAKWNREQLLKEAVEADVNIYRDLAAGKSWAEFVAEMPTNNLGDKVRIIIVKED